MPNFFMKHITSADLFGQEIHLTINHMRSTRTFLGGIISIIILMLITAFTFISSEDVIYKLNPFVTRIDYQSDEYLNLQLDKYTMPIAFCLEDFPNWQKYVSVAAIHYKMDKETQKEVPTGLEVEPCTQSHFPELTEAQYKFLNTRTMICLKNQNITVAGSYTERNVQYFTITIFRCQNTTENGNICASKESIEKNINQGYLMTVFMNSVVNPYNYTNPINHYTMDHYRMPGGDYVKSYEIYIKQEYLESDDGLIYKTNNTYSALAFDYSNNDFTKNGGMSYLIRYYFYASNKTTKTHRIYTKIQAVLAGVGGLVNIATTIIPVLLYIFSITKRNEIILNKLFDYDLSKKENFKNADSFQLKAEPSLRNQGIAPLQKQGDDDKQTDNASFEQRTNLNMSKVSTIHFKKFQAENVLRSRRLQKQKNRLSFTACDILISIFCCRWCIRKSLVIKLQLYDKSKSVITDILEFTYILKKLQELEKLKFVLLSIEQMALLKFISKELQSLNQEKMESNLWHQCRIDYGNKRKMSEIALSYHERLFKNTRLKTKIDAKLFDFYSQYLNNIEGEKL